MRCSVESNRTIINFSKRLNAAHISVDELGNWAFGQIETCLTLNQTLANAFHSGARCFYLLRDETRVTMTMWHWPNIRTKKRGIKLTNLFHTFFAYPCDACDAQPKWEREANRQKNIYIIRKRIISRVSFNFIHASRHSGRQCDAHNHSTVEINGFDMILFTQRVVL